MIKLDIFSDPICPWCYIGKARLEAALEQRPDHPFVVEWHPFQLNPDMPKDGMDRRAYLEGKFGGTQGAKTAYRPIVDTLAQELPDADLGKIKKTPNTMDAHRLIHWAGLEALQTSMVDALFAAYFTQGRDIGDHEVLADIADTVGMDASVVMRLLSSDQDVELISSRDTHARERGITAVPMFVVAQQHAVSGAQNSKLWVEVIDELMAGATDTTH
ncbi:DsbA family oxidoreductase [Pacificibacter marinus]|uniref:DSBA-like thioredoxin domain protein n=1 Tax=Pacificibacter marinus TaxID=658057 RepID=A0A1Y5T502_9RHOB|nr:DsbA family oxidoreductase [Pacificibacter marinus]SEK98563.1 Predicted dithiol-disulfide isomerase, DsbA family [Pacificibacter marinus]SLN54136.1 DSBA-like thioredoxin domain protein [Pacificibacter marinus]